MSDMPSRDGWDDRRSVLSDVTRDGRRKIPALTGIRGYAAFWVVLFHAGFLGAQHSGGVGLDGIPVIRSGYLGVDLFFILSGFVLFLTYSAVLQSPTVGGLRTFATGRIWRILPLHWFVIGCFVLLAPILGRFSPFAQGGNIASFVAAALLVQSLLHLPSTWNPPSWSLSAEWVAYVGFPILVGYVGRLRASLACLIGIAAAYIFLSLLCALSGQPGLNHAQGLGFIRCLVEFPAGMLLCRYSQLSLVDEKRANGIMITGLALLALSLSDPLLDVVALPAFSCLILGSANHSSIAEKILGNKIAVFLGDISFSVYLLHVLILELLLANNGPTIAQPALLCQLLGAVLVTLPLSWTTWRLIEVPAQAYGRKLARRKRLASANG